MVEPHKAMMASVRNICSPHAGILQEQDFAEELARDGITVELMEDGTVRCVTE
jgi:hypothetical protein